MGCGATKVREYFFQKYERNFSNDYKGKKELYNFIHYKCDFSLIATHLSDRIIDIENADYNQITKLIEKTYRDYEKQVHENQISEEEFYDLMYETVTCKLIEKHFQIHDYDIFKQLPYLFEYIYPKHSSNYENVSENEDQEQIKTPYELCIESLKVFEREFENRLLSTVYNLKNELRNLDINVLMGINRNMKFNKNHQPQILSIILTPFILNNKQLIIDLADLIENAERLQILILLIDPVDEQNESLNEFNFNINDHTMLKYLLNAMANNKRIKVFILQCIKEHRIVLAPENANLLITKLQSETLVAFHIGKFMLSDEFLNKLCFQITSTRSLKFLGIDNRKIYTFVKSKLMPALISNSSLLAVAFTGFNYTKDEEIIKEIKQKVYGENEEINIVYLGEDSLVVYPFIPEMLVNDDDDEINSEEVE